MMRKTAMLVAGMVLAAGCNGEPTGTTTDTEIRPSTGMAASELSERDESGGSVARDLATLRRATSSFHQFERAKAAGWSAKITGCMSSAEGGMGFHYGNVGLIDGAVRVDEPELLLYEPEKNGKLRLVAVEYIIPYTAHGRDAAAPVLFGQAFKQNDAFQLWGLHAWVWKENPSGVFASWNPKVGCNYTTDIMAMSRH